MPKMTTCVLYGKRISIEEALRLRDLTRKYDMPSYDFRCDECGEPVRAHKAGPGAAHFEHIVKNRNCSQSDQDR